MERLIQWHLEADEGIGFNAKQFGFSRGQSTISALHRFIAKIEDTLSGGKMALGTFLDIEGAFDNIFFSAITKALNKKCQSVTARRWIMSMITNRNTTVSLHDTTRNLALGRGFPQGGILSPFLWNIVMDGLLGLPRDKITADIQAFADDIALLARGHNANTLRDITQKSINTIEKWCEESGLTLSTVKTHVIMFTRKRKWKMSRPIQVNGTDIKPREHTKFLGVTIDSKLTWNEHVRTKCKKAKALLMMCKRSVGPTWGLSPATMKWIYRTMVRPTLLYASTIWVNAINTDKNLRQLKSVQRLSHLMTTGALPSTSLLALDKITDSTPIDIKVREEAASGALSIMANAEWIDPLTAHNQGRLKSHIRINEKYLNNMPIKANLADKSKPILSTGKNFNLEPSGIEKIDVPLGTEQSNIIACFVKGDKTNDQAGAGWAVYRENILLKEESLRLGRRNTALQAELIAVNRMAQYLLKDKYEADKIRIYTDNLTVLQALDRLMIKTKVCASTFNSLHRLGEKINVTLYWIQAGAKPCGLRRAIELSGEGDRCSTRIAVPVRLSCWKTDFQEISRKTAYKRWADNSKGHVKKAWRDKFKQELAYANRNRLRIATQYLSGHATVNYHLHKYRPDIPKLCAYCGDEDETIEHFIAMCPKWAFLRLQYLDCCHGNINTISDNNPLSEIILYIEKTKRFSLQSR